MKQIYPLLKANTLYHVTEYKLNPSNFMMEPNETIILVRRLRKEAALHLILSVNWPTTTHDITHLELEHLELREWSTINPKSKIEVKQLKKRDLPLFMSGKYRITPNLARILKGEI
jgi:hypothetical protein